MIGEERVLVSLLLDLDLNRVVPKWPPSKKKINNFAFTKHKNRLFLLYFLHFWSSVV
jgi:hypothetical protein